jgi:arylsulfatase A-like enzyme
MRTGTLCLLLLGGCASTEDAPPDKPNVVFLLADDQRPDTLTPVLMPNLVALAGRGAAFTRAVCPNPVCVPSRVEILTGCSSFRNGSTPRLGERPADGLTTWPSAMKAAGYRTATVGKWHVAGKPVDRGYDESPGLFTGGASDTPRRRDLLDREITGYHGWVFQTEDGRKFPEHGIGLTERTDVRIADAAIEFLERRSPQPFFLHVNFTSPHDPLMPPARLRSRFDPAAESLPGNYADRHPFDHGNAGGRDENLWPLPRVEKEVREDLALYHAAIAHLDEQVGRILTALRATGLEERTIVVFASDHGLAIGSHGLRGKQNMYEHTVGVPLILAGPGVPRGVRRSAQVYLREVYPTVCELARVPVPKSVESRSFARVVRGEAAEHHEAVFGYWLDAQRMIRTDRWKLIHYPRIGRTQLFDLIRDPLETDDLSDVAAHAPIRDGLRAKLTAWQKEVSDPLMSR